MEKETDRNINKLEVIECDKIETKDDHLIKFTNGLLETAINDQILAELLNMKLEKKVRLALFRHTMKIFKSAEMEAYQKVRKELIDEHLERENERIEREKEEAKEKGLSEDHVSPVSDLRMDAPEMKELMEEQSGFILPKLQLKSDLLPEEFTIAKMMRLEWLIDFV